ncbi:hypothetical protein GCM10023238_07820 [Streptomyces heliomycini]
MSPETALTRENYREEFPQVNAHMTKKPQVSTATPPTRCTSGRTSATGCTQAGHQAYCLVWP